MGSSSRASDSVIHILLALSDRPRHGYAIMTEVEERTGGAVELGTGTLYTALKRLRNDGLIQEVPDPDASDDARERRTYALTDRGREYLRDQAQRMRALIDHALAKDALPGPELA